MTLGHSLHTRVSKTFYFFPPHFQPLMQISLMQLAYRHLKLDRVISQISHFLKTLRAKQSRLSFQQEWRHLMKFMRPSTLSHGKVILILFFSTAYPSTPLLFLKQMSDRCKLLPPPVNVL